MGRDRGDFLCLVNVVNIQEETVSLYQLPRCSIFSLQAQFWLILTGTCRELHVEQRTQKTTSKTTGTSSHKGSPRSSYRELKPNAASVLRCLGMMLLNEELKSANSIRTPVFLSPDVAMEYRGDGIHSEAISVEHKLKTAKLEGNLVTMFCFIALPKTIVRSPPGK